MKILKYQIEALVSEIRNNRTKKVNQEVELLSKKIDKAKIDRQIKSAVIDMNRFKAKYPELYDEVFEYGIKKSRCDVSENLYNRMLQKEVEKIEKKVCLKYPYKEFNEIYREIVMTSLDCDNFEQLKLKLGIK